MLPVRPTTHSMVITEHNYWLSSGIGCKLKYKIRWFKSLQSLGLENLPAWGKMKFSFGKCILWAGLAAQIRLRPGTQLLRNPTHSRKRKGRTSSKFHSWSCYLQVSEQLDPSRSRLIHWSRLPCGMCGWGQALMMLRLLSTAQGQCLTISQSSMSWSHLSSMGLWAVQYILQVFQRLWLIQNHWQFLL